MTEPEQQQQLEGAEPEEQQEPPPDELTPEAFAALRGEAVKHRRAARAAQQVADEQRRELERLRAEQESETEKAIREAVEAERERLTTEFAGERLQNRLRARAAGRLADPEDAVVHLAGTLEPGTDDAGIDAALADLLEQKTYLAAGDNGGGGERRELVTQGPRSQAPSRTEQSPDAWIRSRRQR